MMEGVLLDPAELPSSAPPAKLEAASNKAIEDEYFNCFPILMEVYGAIEKVISGKA